MDSSRLEAARAVGTFLSTHKSAFVTNGHRAGSAIVVCLESDTVPSVMARVVREVPEPPATLAVFWPETERLEIVALGPGEPISGVEQHVIARTSSIGMLIDGLTDASAPFYFRMNAGFEVASSVSVYADA